MTTSIAKCAHLKDLSLKDFDELWKLRDSVIEKTVVVRKSITIDVPGDPAPQGSKRFLGRSKGGKGIMVESCRRLPAWREAVVLAARRQMAAIGMREPMTGPLVCGMYFTLKKPRSAKKDDCLPDKKPDTSKLVRATEDALKDAGVIVDDAQIVDEHSHKRYAGYLNDNYLKVSGCRIEIYKCGII